MVCSAWISCATDVCIIGLILFGGSSVSSIFAAMTSQFTQANRSDQSPVERTSAMNSIRYKLLALKEFEECHVLAGWIRQLFIDMFNQHERQRNAAPNAEFASADGPREVSVNNCAQSLEVLNTETPYVPDTNMATMDANATIADISHQMMWGHSSASIPSGNTEWNNWLLGYQDGGCNNISERAMMEQLLFSLSYN